MSPILQGLITIIVGVGGCLAYFWGANLLVDRVIFPARGANIARNVDLSAEALRETFAVADFTRDPDLARIAELQGGAAD